MLAIVGAVILALAGGRVSFAQTPQAAALTAVYAGAAPIRIVRVNVAGRYATVLFRGAMIEGSRETAPILVERFSFGWQPLDSLDFRCRLTGHDLGEAVNEQLMREMPQPQDRSVCDSVGKDRGPTAQVEALRRASGGRLRPPSWSQMATGCSRGTARAVGKCCFGMESGRWKLLQGGGGALDPDQMREFHVPETTWCAFGIVQARCPPS